MDEILKADLEALGKLSPQLSAIADRINGRISAGGDATTGADPALAAIQSMTTKTIPNVQRVASRRLRVIGELISEAHQDFVQHSSELETAFKNTPSIYRQR
ncbi:ABC-type transporter Mla subunit MlaD [Mycobacteroides chelonae]|nr:ABC-type transporter Mla subunit MlaD [Mycobacteroides chelonae]